MPDTQLEKDFGEISETTELKSSHLKIGDTLQIKPLSDDSGSVQYYVKYLGGLEKKSLICTLPSDDGKIVFIKENSAFSIRLFSGKNVYAFTSVVEVVYSRPYPHLHFKFPRQVFVGKIRRNQRVDVNIIAAMNNMDRPGDEFRASGRISNISMRGAMFESAKSAGSIGDKIECSFKIKMGAGEAVMAIPGIIRSHNKQKRDDGQLINLHGIEFGDIVFQEKMILQNFIFQCLTGENIDDL